MMQPTQAGKQAQQIDEVLIALSQLDGEVATRKNIWRR